MADWRRSSEHYLALHQIGKIWERITLSLVSLRPEDTLEFTIQKLEMLKSQKDVPGRRIVFVIGGPGSDLKGVSKAVAEECKTFTIDGGAVIEKSGGAGATAEESALRLRKDLLQQETGMVSLVYGYPTTISQALLTEIQVTPASVCIYLDVAVEKQSENSGLSTDQIEEAMKRDVRPLLEYHKAKGNLHVINTADADWQQTMQDIVTNQKSVLASDITSSNGVQ